MRVAVNRRVGDLCGMQPSQLNMDLDALPSIAAASQKHQPLLGLISLQDLMGDSLKYECCSREPSRHGALCRF